MRIIANPVFLEMLLLGLMLVAAFVIGVLIIRRTRQNLTGQGTSARRAAVDNPGFAVSALNAVIQQLKEKEQELQRLRHAASERASASENVSSAVINNLPSGVVLFNSAALVQQANPAARDILGYATTSGLHARDLFRSTCAVRSETPEAPAFASMADAVETCLRKRQVIRRLEVDYSTPAGQQRVLGVTVSPVLGSGNEIIGVACLITDLTEVTGLARQIRLRENLASLGEMSAGIAHEFKNSLATISGYGQMLARENDLPTVHQFAAKITAETESLARIVGDFLNFARPQTLATEPVDIPELLQRSAEECGVDLHLQSLPPELCTEILGDQTALQRCFANLLRNSAQAGRNGAPVRVEVEGTIDGSRAKLVLRDNAGGIPADVLPHIFIPFFTTKANGTGLGLALVHRIVTDHGGTVSVRNEGSGAAFTLWFPLRKQAASIGNRS